jgi:glycerol-3-phosphate O-acyltransferase 3/4
MKYDSRFGDPFWNSSEQSWGEYILRMMTSWAIICEVWYLPPMERLVNNLRSS